MVIEWPPDIIFFLVAHVIRDVINQMIILCHSYQLFDATRFHETLGLQETRYWLMVVKWPPDITNFFRMKK